MTNQKTPVQGGATEEQIEAGWADLHSAMSEELDLGGNAEGLVITVREWLERQPRISNCADLDNLDTKGQVEAAAIALFNIEHPHGYPVSGGRLGWEDSPSALREAVKDRARTIINAALSVSASADPADEHHDAEERQAESEDHAATVTGDREKLIAELRLASRVNLQESHAGYSPVLRGADLARRAAAALAATVEVDEAKLAKVVQDAVSRWMEVHAGWNSGEEPYPGPMAPFIAHSVAEWLRGEGR